MGAAAQLSTTASTTAGAVDSTARHVCSQVDRLSEIFEALDTDESGDAVHYSTLFTDDDDMNQGMTAETIRGQHLQERLEFMQVR